MPPFQLRQIPCLTLAAALLAGCSQEPIGITNDADDPQLGTAIEAITADNGMSQNGMSKNGMSQNGMSQNGLSVAAFGTSSFSTWFNGDRTLGNLVMQYTARCAAPLGTSYSWKNPSTGVTHTWSGQLGLAPGFAAGSAPTVAEQQVLTACLAAHVNKFGVAVPIAIEGRTATGAQIPIGTGELTTYSWREGCFFGNVFNGEGVYVGVDSASWTASKSSSRACAVGTSGCPPIVKTGLQCSATCTADWTGTFWESCSWNGKAYKPLTTRIRPAEVYTCGDGICQVSESCGNGWTAANCSDCGLCTE